MRPQPQFEPFVARLGTGARSVMALHCTMAFSGAWAGFQRRAGNDLTFVAPDMPSHGKSVDWDEVSDFADTVFVATRDALTEPMDLIGHSFGGAIALRLAVEHPDLVRSVTMIEPVTFSIALQDQPDVVAVHDRDTAPFQEYLKAGDREGAARAFNRMWSDRGPKWDAIPSASRQAMTRAIHVVPGTMPFLYEDSAGMLPKLGDMQVPTLVIRGETSHAVVAVTNDGLARRLPNAQSVVIAQAGHMAPISHPAETAAVWRAFLAEHVG